MFSSRNESIFQNKILLKLSRDVPERCIADHAARSIDHKIDIRMAKNILTLFAIAVTCKNQNVAELQVKCVLFMCVGFCFCILFKYIVHVRWKVAWRHEL